ncbi:MAG TPA: lysylphosphatidylglycerol synthase transmembrane domain-containing protein [Candidatus Angelobacter sp.]|nr:lysylphosphatidylglycerol synthase transmembrane domain-containing protein [Candidatus Angelobacter sp.]
MKNKKRVLVTAAVLVILAGLIYLQVRTWRKFDWQRFWAATGETNKVWLAGGIALIYADYFLRAWRWRILLEPVCETRVSRLIAPTMIGFTGLALFGRPGEFIRPYLIARKENLNISSQIAVWTVERIFDMGGFGLIMALNILWFADTLRKLPGFAAGTKKSVLGFHLTSFALFELSGVILLLFVAFMGSLAFWIRKNPAKASAFFRGIFGSISPKIGEAAYHRVHAFGEGLNTVKNFKSFAKLTGLSLLIWIVIGFAYVCVTHAYSIHRLSNMTLSSVLLLTAASVMGGVLQLPVVGGGSQLATIGTLRGVFHLSPEISTSCGIMLWLVTFMSVIPAGLVVAHFERISILRVERESQQEEEQALKEG